MKIYTKTGDKGKTSLIGGVRVPKHHIRVEAYGTIDELNSYIGLLRDQNIDTSSKKTLIKVQNELFVVGSILATSPDKRKNKVDKINENHILFLENEIDKMNDELPTMKHFILPGGHTTVSYCHITRNICRKAERISVALAENSYVNPIILSYLNRLSDYLFVLARKLSKDLQIEETSWRDQ